MLLSTETKSLRQRVGDERALEIIAQAGFDAADFTFDAMCDPGDVLNTNRCFDTVDHLREKAQGLGLRFNQAHAPFLFDWDDPKAYDEQILPAVARSIALAARLGAPHIVVHPIHHLEYAKNAGYLRGINRDYFAGLLPVAKKHQIRLALENMFQVDPVRCHPVPDVFADPYELLDFLDEMSDPMLTVCVDVGHVGLAGGEAPETIRVLGKRVQALHIHDNDYRSDQHLPPYLGRLDWDAVAASLCEIGYSGDFTFEAANFYQGFDRELLPAAARFLEQIGRHLMTKIVPAEKGGSPE